MLEKEKWNQAQIPLKIQHFVHELSEVNGSRLTSTLTASMSMLSIDKSNEFLPSHTAEASDLSNDPETMNQDNNTLIVINHKYFAVSTTLELINALSVYIRAAHSFTGIHSDIFSKLIEILKVLIKFEKD